MSDTAMSQASYLTPAAHERLQAELERLSGPGRVEIAKRIEAAREEGDLRENGGYHAAKEEQGKMEARIRQLGGGPCWKARSSATPRPRMTGSWSRAWSSPSRCLATH